MMLTLPVNLMPLIGYFAPQFSKRVWNHVQVLLVGALLTPGRRTVTAALRVCGIGEEKHFQNYHRILNRARWSSLALARLLLRLLLRTFASDGPLIIGLLDATLYDPAPPRPPKQNGRPRVKGVCRSTLQQVLNSSATPWTLLKVRHWYGGEERAVWYHTGLPPVEIRWC
jgi:hypothetical protein